MLGKQAKIVSPATLRRMLAYARQTRQPKRDAVIVLLSVKAGLRACEIGDHWTVLYDINVRKIRLVEFEPPSRAYAVAVYPGSCKNALLLGGRQGRRLRLDDHAGSL